MAEKQTRSAESARRIWGQPPQCAVDRSDLEGGVRNCLVEEGSVITGTQAPSVCAEAEVRADSLQSFLCYLNLPHELLPHRVRLWLTFAIPMVFDPFVCPQPERRNALLCRLKTPTKHMVYETHGIIYCALHRSWPNQHCKIKPWPAVVFRNWVPRCDQTFLMHCVHACSYQHLVARDPYATLLKSGVQPYLCRRPTETHSSQPVPGEESMEIRRQRNHQHQQSRCSSRTRL